MSFGLLYIFIVMVFWRPQEWLVPGLYGIPLLQGVTYASMLTMMLEHESNRVRFDWKEPQFFLFFGLFIAGLMSHISWGYLYGLLMSWETVFRLSFFGILMFACTTNVNQLRWIARAFVVMALLMAVHAILQETRGYGFAGHTPVMSWRPNVSYLVPRSRFFGIFNDPNDLGQFLMTAMPLCFVFFKKRRFLQFLMACGAVWWLFRGLEATISRGAQVGLVATAGVAATMFIFKKRYLWVLGLGLLAGLMMIPLSGPFLGAAWERVNLWGQANRAFLTRPFFGVGLHMIRDYTFQAKSVHNAYVSCYAQIGVFGFFFWMSLMLVAVIGLLQTRRWLRYTEHPDGRWLYDFSAWGLASLAGFAASAYFLSRAFVFPLYFLTAMLGRVPSIARQYVPESQQKDAWLGLSIRDTCIIGIPVSLLTIVYVYVSILILNMQR